MAEENVIPQPIINLLSEFDKSPAFAMSRGGRELFHTNFLAFILEQATNDNQETYPQIIKKMLLENFYGKDSAPTNVLVLREKLNFDLLIIPIDKVDGLTDQPKFGETNITKNSEEKTIEIVVIEAKLKSIPTVEQLEKYNNTLKNDISIDLIDDENSAKLLIKKCNKIIELNNGLTYDDKRKITFNFKDLKYKCILLAPEAFELKATNWTFLTWTNFLGEPRKQNPSSDDRLAVFIKDYLESTYHTIDLIDKVKKAFDNNFKNQRIESIVNFCTHDAFKKRRIHDLVGKVVYELLAKQIHEQLKDNNKLIYKAFFSNSTPGLQLEFVINDDKKETGIGVQLQGKEYRHYIRRNFTDESAGNTLLEIANKYREDWLSKDGNKGKKQKKEEVSEEQFKKFDENRFLYLSRDVGQLTVNELIDAFKRSLIDDCSDITNPTSTAFKVFQKEKKNDQNQSSTKSAI